MNDAFNFELRCFSIISERMQPDIWIHYKILTYVLSFGAI